MAHRWRLSSRCGNRYALIQRRETFGLTSPPRIPEMTTFTGQQVLPTDEDIEAVWARPMLTWEAPRRCCASPQLVLRGRPARHPWLPEITRAALLL